MRYQRGFVGVGGLIAILLGLIVLAGGAHYLTHRNPMSSSTVGNNSTIQQPQTTNNTSIQTTSATTSTSPAAATSTSSFSMKIYTDSGHGFSIRYPSLLQVDTTNLGTGSFYTSTAQGLISIDSQTPYGTQPQYGGVETLTISVSADPTDVGNCMVAPQSEEDSVSNTKTIQINGVSFLFYEIGDAATGHFTDTAVYHTIKNNACYSIEKITHTSRTETDQEAQQQQNDVSVSSSELDPIIQSFTFASASASVQPPTCSLTSDEFANGRTGYALGDVITLTWQSQNAQRAVWKPVVDQSTGLVTGNVVPDSPPSINGTATTIASVTGFQSITLQVTGSGGFGQCSTNFSVSPSSATPSMTVGGVRFNPNGQYNNNNNYSDVTLSGTITNGALYNDEVNIVLEDPTYTGPFDYSSVYSSANRQYFWSGGSTPGARDDSESSKNWSAETFVRTGATQVRVLVYPFFYNRNNATAYQPIINQVFTISQ